MDAKVTSKGQITVPKSVRERLNVGPGDYVLFREQPDGTFIVEAASTDIMTLAGTVRSTVKGVTIENMAAAVSDEAIARATPSKRRRRK